jgi:hypothetical protein
VQEEESPSVVGWSDGEVPLGMFWCVGCRTDCRSRQGGGFPRLVISRCRQIDCKVDVGWCDDILLYLRTGMVVKLRERCCCEPWA